MELQAHCFDITSGHIVEQKLFTLYLRYQTTHERAFSKCLNDLLKLRSEKRKAEIGFASQNRQEELHEIKKRRQEMAVKNAEASLDFQLMMNVSRYCGEINKDPAQDARFREELRRYDFDNAA
jgi:hypothetical protein